MNELGEYISRMKSSPPFVGRALRPWCYQHEELQDIYFWDGHRF